MMEVTGLPKCEENLTIRLNDCELQIHQHISNPASTETGLGRILRELDSFDTEVLNGDWGENREQYKRAVIHRLDSLRAVLVEGSLHDSPQVVNRGSSQLPTGTSDTHSEAQTLPKLSSHLNTILVLSPNGAFSSPTCSICLNRFTDENNDQGYASCGHRFHAACIRSWASSKGGSVPCPLCGHNILEPQYTPVLEPVTGKLKEETKQIIQAWRDERLMSASFIKTNEQEAHILQVMAEARVTEEDSQASSIAQENMRLKLRIADLEKKVDARFNVPVDREGAVEEKIQQLKTELEKKVLALEARLNGPVEDKTLQQKELQPQPKGETSSVNTPNVPRYKVQVLSHTKKKTDRGTKTFYVVEVEIPNNKRWKLCKRYSHFRDIYEELKPRIFYVKNFPFPSRTGWLYTETDAVIEERQTVFDRFCKMMVRLHPMPAVVQNFFVQDFYDLKGIPTKQAKITGGGATAEKSKAVSKQTKAPEIVRGAAAARKVTEDENFLLKRKTVELEAKVAVLQERLHAADMSKKKNILRQDYMIGLQKSEKDSIANLYASLGLCS